MRIRHYMWIWPLVVASVVGLSLWAGQSGAAAEGVIEETHLTDAGDTDHPGIYVFQDHSHHDPADYPGIIVGGHQDWPWSQIEPAEGEYAWWRIDNWIASEAALGKPVGFSVETFSNEAPENSAIPSWMYDHLWSALHLLRRQAHSPLLERHLPGEIWRISCRRWPNATTWRFSRGLGAGHDRHVWRDHAGRFQVEGVFARRWPDQRDMAQYGQCHYGYVP